MESTSLGTFRKAIADEWDRMRTMGKRGTVTCILHGLYVACTSRPSAVTVILNGLDAAPYASEYDTPFAT